jgi:hypothetical protein
MTEEQIAELREKCRKESEAGWQTCASVGIDTLLALLDELENLRRERAAVVAWLREYEGHSSLAMMGLRRLRVCREEAGRSD